jgi:hypothetical protein
MGQRSGPLEWRAEPAQPATDDEGSPGDDVSWPRPLAEGALASGSVHADEDEDWFEIRVPDGQHSMQLMLTAADSVGVALRLHTSDGEAIPMTWAPGDLPGSIVYSAEVQPDATYVVEVLQPPSSIVVTFDTSASVVTQLAAIEAGIRSLAAGMREDREALRIVPFDGQPLLPHWSSDRYEVADAVNRYTLGPSSSGVEANLEHAVLDLAARDGGRAVLLLTDAASSTFDRSERLWAAVSAVRPRIFPVAVGGEAELPAIERHHLMADWAVATGGVSSPASDGTAVQAAFDRLAAWLRRPAAYSLTYRTSPEELAPPAPGRIVVAAANEGPPTTFGQSDALELVVDTSGSMRKRLAGGTRIELAREVLARLVQDDLPAGVPVALRRFPPRGEPCGSDLLVPLAPLDRASMTDIIGQLDAPRDARTPLAEAIAAAARDLADVAGRRLIVVVSDGKESCKGDPLAEIERLRAEGVDVTLNIVGLALDRASRRGIARLAEAGGGAYVDARDGTALGAALLAALGAPVEARDATGAVVGRSTVGGEPIELPPGTYDLIVRDEPSVTFPDVYLEPGADVLLTLPVPDG